MEEGSFAANGVKHCIRPMDMAGKSAAFILRQMHELVVSDAKMFDINVELPMQLSCLQLESKNAVPFFQQKKIESDETLDKKTKRGPRPKEKQDLSKLKLPNFEEDNSNIIKENLNITDEKVKIDTKMLVE